MIVNYITSISILFNNVSALGYSTDCEGMSTHELKAVDFEFTNELQEGRNADQYFVVCVNQVTEDDLQAYSDARENYGRSVSLVRLKIMIMFCI